MILEEIRKKPFIHFGFNNQKIKAYINEEIEVWIDTIYLSSKDRGMALFFSGDIVQDDFNYKVIKFDSIGTYEVKVKFDNREKKTIESNIITVEIINVTADGINWTADSKKITADGSIL